MPLVDLDDELSIVNEQDEEEEPMYAPYDSEMDNSVFTGVKSDMSAMEDMSHMSGLQSYANSEVDEKEQQWTIDSLLDGQDDPEEGDDDAMMMMEGSETDDSSLYIMDLEKVKKGDKDKEGGTSTPKMENRKKTPSPNEVEFESYMKMSGIVTSVGDEKEKSWKKKVLGKSKKNVAQDKKKSPEQAPKEKSTKKSFGRSSSNGDKSASSDQDKSPNSGGWKNKNPFRGSKNKKAQEQSRKQQDDFEPYEANLAPLGGIDDVDADVSVNSEGSKQEKEGWMPKIFGKNATTEEEQAPNTDTVAPVGAVKDVEIAETTMTDESPVVEDAKKDVPQETNRWGSRMSNFISSVTESKQQEPSKEEVPVATATSTVSATSTNEQKNESSEKDLMMDTAALADDIASFASSLSGGESKKNSPVEKQSTEDSIVALATSLSTKQESDADGIVAFATSLTKKTVKSEDGEEADDDVEKGVVALAAKGDVAETKDNDAVEETEESFIESSDESLDELAEQFVVASVASGELTAIPEGTDDNVSSKNTWKSKVKSVRKQGSNKLSSIRKSTKKSFTQSKMSAMEAEETSADSLGSGSVEKDVGSSPVVQGVVRPWSPQRKRRIGCVILGLLFTIIVIAVTISAVRKGNDDQTPQRPTEVTQEYLEYLYALLLPISGQALTVEDPDSPLVKSFIWVAKDSIARGDPDEVIVQRYVSAVLYYSLDGENWRNQNKFLSQEDLCKWNTDEKFGIICSGNEVSELQLAKNNLSGELPQEIRHLSTLRAIVMNDNGIGGTLPANIGEIDWLQAINLSSNVISGTLPDSLFTPNQLVDIMLNNNTLSGTINPSLGNSQVLERFSAYENLLSGTLPSSIGQSTVLQDLDLGTNELRGTIPEFVGSSAIERVYLGSNKIAGTIPQSLANAPFLAVLQVSRNNLNGVLPDFTQYGTLKSLHIGDNDINGALGSLFSQVPTTIENLVITNNRFGGTIPTRAISTYDSLTQLRLENNLIQGTIPEGIGALTGLTELFLTNNNLEGPIPTTIGNLKKLEGIRMRLNLLTGTIPSEIGGLTLLEDLMLDGNNLVGEIPEEIASLPALTTVLLSENDGITGGTEPFCRRQDPLERFGVNTCGEGDETSLACPCCNICCNSVPSYGCFKV